MISDRLHTSLASYVTSMMVNDHLHLWLHMSLSYCHVRLLLPCTVQRSLMTDLVGVRADCYAGHPAVMQHMHSQQGFKLPGIAIRHPEQALLLLCCWLSQAVVSCASLRF